MDLGFLIDGVKRLVPLLVAVLAVAGALFVVNRLFETRFAARPHNSYRRQISMLGITVVGLLVIIMASPLSDAQKSQLLSLLGVLLTAGIALSSTTFLGNAMAGVMLRATRSFRMGDFVRVGDHFGRVSERGLFHTEIQTEDRDLMTLPNLYLVTNPVKVVRASGTIVCAEVSLGYDVPRTDVETMLIQAASAAELDEPFVHILELGDFSVTYRISGLLPEVKQVISARSRLREMMLDKLHAGGVEIVSPSFMNTRAIAERRSFIPSPAPEVIQADREVAAESLAFDKAEEAESVEKLQARHDELNTELSEYERQLKESPPEEKERLNRRIEQVKGDRDRVARIVAKKTKELEA